MDYRYRRFWQYCSDLYPKAFDVCEILHMRVLTFKKSSEFFSSLFYTVQCTNYKERMLTDRATVKS